MKTINLYLDDLRDCPIGFSIARTVTECKDYFKKYKINILSLDHDLGVDENGILLQTGYDFVKYFCENGLYAKKIYLHTDNIVGKMNMYETLLSAQKHGLIKNDIEIYSYPFVKNKYSND